MQDNAFADSSRYDTGVAGSQPLDVLQKQPRFTEYWRNTTVSKAIYCLKVKDAVVTELKERSKEIDVPYDKAGIEKYMKLCRMACTSLPERLDYIDQMAALESKEEAQRRVRTFSPSSGN